jgi:hypothetical protein
MSISPVTSSTSSQAALQPITTSSLQNPNSTTFSNIATLTILSAAAAQQTQQVNLNAVVAFQSTAVYGSGMTPSQLTVANMISDALDQLAANQQRLVDQLKADAEAAAADLASGDIWGFLSDVASGVINVLSNAAKAITDTIKSIVNIFITALSNFIGFSAWTIADNEQRAFDLLSGPNAALTILTEENSLNALIPYVNTGTAISKINNVVTAKGMELTNKLSAQDLAQTVDAENTAISVSVSSTASVAVEASAEAASTEAVSSQAASTEAASTEAATAVAAMFQPPNTPRSETQQQAPAPLYAAVTQARTAQLEALQAVEKAQAISAVDDLNQITSLEKHHLVAEAQQAKLMLTSLRNSANATSHSLPPRKD